MTYKSVFKDKLFSGKVILVTGGGSGMAHSGAARAGMVSLTETAALEWAQAGVRVNAVAPGYIASSGMDHYPPEAGPMLREMRETVPLGRFGTEAETSAAIVFLLSPAASFISGTTLRAARRRQRLWRHLDDFGSDGCGRTVAHTAGKNGLVVLGHRASAL